MSGFHALMCGLAVFFLMASFVKAGRKWDQSPDWGRDCITLGVLWAYLAFDQAQSAFGGLS